MISKLAQNIKPSATLAISAKAKQMKKEGIDVVSFGAGEPDFDTPDNIKEAAIKAINEGFTKYTDASGIAELKEAICNKLKRENNIEYQKENIIVSCGGKHSLYNAILAVVDKGEKVILPSPYWVSYIEQVNMAGGKTVVCKTKKFKVTAEMIEKKIKPKTKLLILNYPNNPSGATIDKEELQKIGELAITHNFYILSDEVYEKFTYGKGHVSIASLGEEIKKRTITMNAVSKTYSMTGWRIGYCAAPVEITKAMNNIQSQTTSNPTSISQKAALEALNGPQDSVQKMKEAFEERRNYMIDMLNRIKGVKCEKPDGAFYAFPNISKFKLSSTDFCAQLLEKEKVAAVPGIEFGDDKCIRISYATSMENIKKGLERIENFCNSL